MGGANVLRCGAFFVESCKKDNDNHKTNMKFKSTGNKELGRYQWSQDTEFRF